MTVPGKINMQVFEILPELLLYSFPLESHRFSRLGAPSTLFIARIRQYKVTIVRHWFFQFSSGIDIQGEKGEIRALVSRDASTEKPRVLVGAHRERKPFHRARWKLEAGEAVLNSLCGLGFVITVAFNMLQFGVLEVFGSMA